MRVAGVGAYVPRFRLPTDAIADALGQCHARGVEAVAVPDADEDALTMAAEAGERALDAAGLDPESVDALHLASTTLPYEEEAGTSRLRSLLGLGEHTESAQFGGSTDAGGAALAAGLERDAPTLVVASDTPQGIDDEALGHAAGAGAAAVVLDRDGPGRVAGRGSRTTTNPGTRFRERGSAQTTGLGVTSYDRQAFRETLAGAVEGLDTSGVDAAALQAPDGDLPYRVAGALGLDTDTVAAGSVVERVGDAGAASALLGLAGALRDGARSVLLATHGSGAASHAFRVVAERGIPVRATVAGDRELSFAGARRRRGDFDSGPPAGGGASVSVPSYRRTLAARHRLVAGRCRSCSALRFPPEGACGDCGATDGYEDAPLRTRGTVETSTTISQGGAPPEFAPQQARSGEYGSAIVSFEGRGEGSGEVSVPVQVVLADGDTPGIGDEVVVVPRVLYDQEGVRRYGAKAVPADSRRG
ncbi:zinc ribbon domain-containing protein [Halobacterium jilantaiense]|uniref:Hydroxymethylglutaryl-CoA synthase n=1 Tax=Halobacterium jilantaiense TaxID=355548 RepID=A0A1I0NBI0_9EURY|nr:zinc ribbon domain-containing protein [Halobacterium jilantaiense]SEV98554.1 hydroxymethylglutaryl-CoA synthase [Halobacterium jilantaiense]